MGKDTHEIRREIEQTRERIGDTAEAIGYKADLTSRVRDSVHGRIAGAKQTFQDGVETITSMGAATADAAAGVRSATARAVRNPLGLAIGAWAVGFLAGVCLPVTEVEERNLGPIREKIVDRIQAADLVEHGKQVLHETTQAAVDSTREHAGQVTKVLTGGEQAN